MTLEEVQKLDNEDLHDAHVMLDCITRFAALVSMFSLKSITELHFMVQKSGMKDEQEEFYNATLNEIERQMEDRKGLTP